MVSLECSKCKDKMSRDYFKLEISQNKWLIKILKIILKILDIQYSTCYIVNIKRDIRRISRSYLLNSFEKIIVYLSY